MDEQDDIVSEAVPKYKPAAKDLPFEEGKHYTYSDYITWGDDVRYELIKGIPIVMEAPSRRHQGIVVELARQFSNFLKGKPCKVYVSPFDVRINAKGADDTVVQPDLLVICDHSILTDAGCSGAPDMVIEISSPSTAQRDRLIKLQLYEEFGVSEYWVVEPESNAVTVYILENGHYFIKVYSETDVLPVNVLDGCEINLAEVFSE